MRLGAAVIIFAAAFAAVQANLVKSAKDRLLLPRDEAATVDWDVIKLTLDMLEGTSKLSSDPEIYTYPNFLSAEECDHLKKLHDDTVEERDPNVPWCFMNRNHIQTLQREGKVQEADLVSGRDCLTADAASRLGFAEQMPIHSNTQYRRFDDTVLDTIEKRMVQKFALVARNSFLTQLVSYAGDGQAFLPHTDCRVQRPTENFNDRAVTVIVYLDDVAEGGETVFTEIDLVVKPRKGMALIWLNLLPDGSCNPLTKHEARPAVHGKKYILQKWFHTRKLVPYVQEEMLCDRQLQCREYISTATARQTALLSKQGFELLSQGNKTEARPLLEQAVAISPHDVHANLYLGHALPDDKFEAEDQLLKTLVLSLNASTEAKVAYARKLEERGDDDEAEAEYNDVLALYDPNNLPARVWLTLLNIRLERWPNAYLYFLTLKDELEAGTLDLGPARLQPIEVKLLHYLVKNPEGPPKRKKAAKNEREL